VTWAWGSLIKVLPPNRKFSCRCVFDLTHNSTPALIFNRLDRKNAKPQMQFWLSLKKKNSVLQLQFVTF